MNFLLKVWRQKNRQAHGKLVDYDVRDISPNTSFLEMLDILNENLLQRGEEPIAFDSDCREGICGTCSLTINGEARRGSCDGSRSLHWLWCMRSGLSKWVGDAFHLCESLASCPLAAGTSRTGEPRLENGAGDGRGRLWQLHQHLRMRSGLSRRDQRQCYCQTESRIRARRPATRRRRITLRPDRSG